MKRILPIIIFIGLFVFLAKSLYQPQTNIPSPLIGKPMPTFSLSELNSDTSLTDSDILGNISLINVWATWCAPCRDEMPTLERLQAHLAHEDFVVFAVSQDVDGLATVKPYVSEYGYTFPVLIDVGGEIGRRYGVTGYPESFVIDRTGQVVYHHVGYNDWAQMNVVTAIRGLITRGQWQLG